MRHTEYYFFIWQDISTGRKYQSNFMSEGAARSLILRWKGAVSVARILYLVRVKGGVYA
jgi:hypothetical protein